MTQEIKLIKEIDFGPEKVQIYYDPYSDENDVRCCWSARNKDSFYQGYCYLGPEGITYPEGAVIPEQTKEDREIIPKFLIVGKKDLDNKFMDNLNLYLKESHKVRNGL